MSAMKRLFQIMADKKASDIFISTGAPINIKIRTTRRIVPIDISVSRDTCQTAPAIIRWDYTSQAALVLLTFPRTDQTSRDRTRIREAAIRVPTPASPETLPSAQISAARSA